MKALESVLMTTKEVAAYLKINEKMVYTLVAEKGLPATKVTGKWLFPRHLVSHWIEHHTENLPAPGTDSGLAGGEGLLVVAGSNDLLLDRALTFFNTRHPEHMAVFGNFGSMGGLRALRRNCCHIAGCHLMEESTGEYNFAFARRELEKMPAIINFCRREQGLLLPPGNPRDITTIADLGRQRLRIINRPLGTGTRLLFDRELTRAGIKPSRLPGYETECHRHLDVGLAVLAGKVDAGPGIRPVAGLLGLDFVPIQWERYDLLVAKDRFFEPAIQSFLALLHDPLFVEMGTDLKGYDLNLSGKMIFNDPELTLHTSNP